MPLESLLAFLSSYGYVAVFFAVALESAGVPFPGEATLLAAAISSGVAGEASGLRIEGVVAAAAAGAMFGDNIGFWAGRRLGFPLLQRYGPKIGLDARRLALGRLLFERHGGKIVFFGRFVAVLRAFAALLAGASGLTPLRFFIFNAAGAIVWATLFGTLGHAFGQEARRLTGPIGLLALFGAAAFFTFAWRFYKVEETRFFAEAEAASTSANQDEKS